MLATVTAVRPSITQGQKRIDDLAGDLRQIVPLGDVRHQDHELVAAQPRHRIDRAQAVLHALRRFLEQGIPCCMAEVSFTSLKWSRSRPQHADAPTVTIGALGQLLEAVHQQRAVRQSGQHIVVGEPVEALPSTVLRSEMS